MDAPNPKKLQSLRAAIVDQLAVLDAVLADPSRGESLEDLIRDLARLATEEAQLAAADVRREVTGKAEHDLADVRAQAQTDISEVQTALNEERSAGARLQGTLDQAQQRIASLERDQQTAARSGQEQVDQLQAALQAERAKVRQLDAEVSRLKADVALLTGDAGRLTADVARLKADVDRRTADVDRRTAEAGRLKADLDSERSAVADTQRRLADVQGQLADAQEQLADAQEQLADAQEQLADAQEQLAGAQAQVAHAQAQLTDTHAQLADVQAQLEATAQRERQAVARLEQAYQEGQQQAAAARAAQEQLETEMARAREAVAAELARTREGAAADLAHAREAVAAELAHERESAAETRRKLAEAELYLQTTSVSDRATVDRLEKALQESQQQTTAAYAAQEQLELEIARERDAATVADRVLTEIKAQFAAEQAKTAEMRPLIDEARVQLRQAARDHGEHVERARAAQEEIDEANEEADALRADLQAAQAKIEALEVQLITGFVPPAASSASAPQAPQAPRPKSAAPKATKAAKSDEAEWTVVRLTNRYAFPRPIDVMANGETGLLLDLSETGCQLMLSGALKVNQTIRVMLPAEPKPLAFPGKVVWARLEPPTGVRPTTYRAGVQFTKRDDDAVAAFVARHGAV